MAYDVMRPRKGQQLLRRQGEQQETKIGGQKIRFYEVRTRRESDSYSPGDTIGYGVTRATGDGRELEVYENPSHALVQAKLFEMLERANAALCPSLKPEA